MIDFSLLIVGIAFGYFARRSEKKVEEVSPDLSYYRNLSESLLQDVKNLREENIKLKNEKL
jgi:hypothetical protein